MEDERRNSPIPAFVVEAKTKLESLECSTSLKFLASVREIANEFNAKTQLIDQNVAEAKDTMSCKLEALRKYKADLLELRESVTTLRDEYLTNAQKIVQIFMQSDPTILKSFEEVSAKQDKLTRLNLEKQGNDLLLQLDKSVSNRNLDEIKACLGAALDHEKVCRNYDSIFDVYPAALSKCCGQILPGIKSELYVFLKNDVKFPFEDGDATTVSREHAVVLRKFMDIMKCLYTRINPDDWPTDIGETFFKPIHDRFYYHFYGDKKTNDKYHPRWFLTQLLSWIRANLEFFEQTLNSIEDIFSFNPMGFFHYRISTLAIDKMNAILASQGTMEDSLLFSKLVDELVEFEAARQQLDPFAYGINTLTVFCGEEIIKNWIHMEHEVSLAYLDDILTNENRWKNRLGEIDDVDEHAVCQCADYFLIHVVCIQNRSRFLPDSHSKKRFFDLQLFLFDEFRERLSQIANTADSPWNEPFPQIMNAIWFLCDTLKEWNDTDVFDGKYPKSAALESTSRMYRHLWTQMADDAVNSLRVQLSELAHQYQQYRWSSVDTIGTTTKEISPLFCPLLLKIRSVFASAGNLLSQASLSTVYKLFTTAVAEILFNEVQCTAFVECGASQMLFDMEEGLIPVLNNIFDRHRLPPMQSTYNPVMVKLIGALRLLSLPWPAATLLREELSNSTDEQAEEKLLEMKISGITSEEAEKCFNQRNDMKNANLINIAVK